MSLTGGLWAHCMAPHFLLFCREETAPLACLAPQAPQAPR